MDPFKGNNIILLVWKSGGILTRFMTVKQKHVQSSGAECGNNLIYYNVME